MTADKEVVGLVSLEEDLWTQYTAATTLRIDMHNTVSGYVEVKLHHTAANDCVRACSALHRALHCRAHSYVAALAALFQRHPIEGHPIPARRGGHYCI